MLPNIPVLQPPKIESAIVIKVEKKEPKKYIIKNGDTLTSISKAHNVPLERLWAKNTELTDPNQIEPEKALIIPENEEVLAARPLPVTIEAPAADGVSRPIASSTGGYSSSGNGYDPGYCTWYVKNRRPDLPNNLGNADTWYSRAKAMGLPVGLEPRAGAAAQVRGRMHVVYVESVNGDGTIVISEMNYSGLYSLRTITVDASNYWYIY